MKYLCLSVALMLVLGSGVMAQGENSPAPAKKARGRKAASGPVAPAVLPGKGLAEHDFFYAGEAKERKMFIVRKGQIVWSYDDPKGKGEISDAILYPNGNVLLAHQYAVELIGPDKKVFWKLDTPQGCEIHTAQMIGKEHVLYVQNGDPALVRVVNIKSGKTVKELKLPVKNPKSVHGHFRHARLTPEGTLLVAHMDLAKIAEYDAEGKEVWSKPAQGAWGVAPLKNGNILYTDKSGTHEVNRKSGVVWEITTADVPEYKLSNLQLGWRLANGNTVFNNWFNQWSGKVDPANAPVQAIEVTPEKKVVWALRAWTPPADLGPATTIQFLDPGETTEMLENVSFGEIR